MIRLSQLDCIAHQALQFDARASSVLQRDALKIAHSLAMLLGNAPQMRAIFATGWRGASKPEFRCCGLQALRARERPEVPQRAWRSGWLPA